MPSATSSEIAPVGITSIGTRASSPSRMTEPRPNCRSIWASAVSRALSLSPTLLPGLSMPAIGAPVGIKGFPVGADATRRLRQNPCVPMNATETARDPAVRAAQLTTLAEQLFDHEQDTPASPAPLPACTQTSPDTAQTSPDTVITALVRAHTPASRTVSG